MTDDVQAAFRALADPSRRSILRHLSERDMTIAEVAQYFDMTRAAVKKHLVILEDGDLISVRAEGRERINHLEPRALKPAVDWLGHFSRYWDTRLGKLHAAIKREKDRMSEATITKTAFFDVPREIVWAYLTEKDKLAEWFHPADADLAPGRDYVLLADSDGDVAVRQCWGTVLEMDRPSRLVYTFTVGPMNGAVSTVTWTLSDAFDGTKLTLEHTGIDAAGESVLGLLTALDAGWDAHLSRLRQAV